MSRLVAAPVPTRSRWLEPLHAFPAVEPMEAGQLLADAVRGVELGNADRALLMQLERYWSPESVAVLASLLLRAREQGARTGVSL